MPSTTYASGFRCRDAYTRISARLLRQMSQVNARGIPHDKNWPQLWLSGHEPGTKNCRRAKYTLWVTHAYSILWEGETTVPSDSCHGFKVNLDQTILGPSLTKLSHKGKISGHARISLVTTKADVPGLQAGIAGQESVSAKPERCLSRKAGGLMPKGMTA